MWAFLFIIITIYSSAFISETMCRRLNINSGSNIVMVSLITQWVLTTIIFLIFHSLGLTTEND